MAYQPYSTPPPQEIYLYTTPLRYQRNLLGIKKPTDVFAHWAVCIDGVCYELTRGNPDADQPKYDINWEREQAWVAKKDYEAIPGKDRKCVKKFAGTTSGHYSWEVIWYIATQVWEKSLQKSYVYDENNCQVFIRLLVDLIGDKKTKADFPSFFDKWVKGAGISRDVSAYSIAAGGTMLAAGLTLSSVDPTLTSAAGFGVAASMVLRSSTALLTDRYQKEKFIKQAQKEIEEDLIQKCIIPRV